MYSNIYSVHAWRSLLEMKASQPTVKKKEKVQVRAVVMVWVHFSIL